MGCAIVQQTCSEVRTSLKYQSDTVAQCDCASCLSSLLPESCRANRPSLLTVCLSYVAIKALLVKYQITAHRPFMDGMQLK